MFFSIDVRRFPDRRKIAEEQFSSVSLPHIIFEISCDFIAYWDRYFLSCFKYVSKFHFPMKTFHTNNEPYVGNCKATFATRIEEYSKNGY